MANELNLSPSRQAELTGSAILPLVAALIYGIWRLVEFGMADKLAVFLTAVSLLSAVCAVWSIGAAFQPPRNRRVRLLAAFLGGMPWAFGLFLVVFLGAWAAVEAVTHYNGILPLVGALFWALVGYREMAAIKKVRPYLGRGQSN